MTKMPTMGKFPKPPCFSECYVCGREFSSRSLDIHEPQCLVKWHRNNNKLPVSLRKAAPVNSRPKCVPPTPSHICAHHLMDEEYDDEIALLTPVVPSKESPKTIITSSKPNSKKRPLTYTPTASPANEDVPVLEIPRPGTATLEHPKILDESYVDKLDMSLFRKEVLDVANICKVSTPVKPNIRAIKHSLEARSNKVKSKGRISAERNDRISKRNRLNSSRERINACPERAALVRETRRSRLLSKNCKKLKTPVSQSPLKLKPKFPVSNDPVVLEQPSKCVSDPKNAKKVAEKNKQNKPPESKCKAVIKVEDSTAKKESVAESRKNVFAVVATPCTACNRQERPERFHSHPPPVKAIERSVVEPVNVTKTKPIQKNIVQKPIPLRFQSGGNQPSPVFHNNKPGHVLESRSKKNGPVKETNLAVDAVKNKLAQHQQPPAPKQTAPKMNLLENEKKAFVVVGGESPKFLGESPKFLGKARMISCYLCGKEFGSSSFPLHHPRCLEKWTRNNSLLPPEQRRMLPLSPSSSLTAIEWNDNAWRLSQSHLVECENCSRTFLPDRLQVHLRSCRSPPEGTKPRSVLPPHQKPREDEAAPPTPSPRPKRPIVPCYVCGREFGSKSIGIHEPQCLSKWKTENEKLPPQQRRPEPRKPGETNQEPAMQTSPSPVSPRPPQGQPSRPPTVPCYLCGRQFGTKSIAIHEPQCLKKWRSENEKLPPEKRRPEPQKPELRFKENGQVDCEATFEAIWETHLQQLVPCKTCGRTFFPDRIEIHERSCKGQVKK